MKTLALTTSLLAASSIASAQIAMINNQSDSGTADTSIISNFALGAGNTLAVIVVSETSSSPNHTVFFGADLLVNSVFVQEGNQAASVSYIINPSSTTADVIVSMDQSGFYAVSAVSLSNVDSLLASGTFGEPDSNLPFDINYAGAAGGFVLAGMVDNAFDGPDNPLSITGDNIDDYLVRIPGDSGATAGRATAYGNVAMTGNFTTTFTDGGTSTSSRNAGALVSFSPTIPEPSTYAMITGIAILGLSTLVRRRIKA